MNFDHTPEMGDRIYEKNHMCFADHDHAYDSDDGSRRGCHNDPKWDYRKFPVAMAYVPMQPWEGLYDLETGLRRGTIFPSLDKPFMGGGPK